MKNEITIEFIKRYISAYLSDYSQLNDSLEVVVKDCAERMGKDIVAFVDMPSEQLQVVEDYATFYTPKTWFQHFKKTYFNDWLLKKFPVQWHEEKMRVEIKISAVYPQLPQVFKKGVGQIRYHYGKDSPISHYPTVNDGENYF
jgi:hypothetical protein